jgi:hypothetical protein
MSEFKLDATLHSYVLLLHNLPLDTTREELAAWLYRETGLNVGDSSYIALQKAGDLKMKAFIPVTRHSIADFLDRMLAGRTFKAAPLTVRSAKPD